MTISHSYSQRETGPSLEPPRLPFALRYPSELPITDKRGEILEAFLKNQVLVVTGETGSGKSTQLPKICLESGHGRGKLIGCTQPRRIAAISLAQRVAEELGPEGAPWVGSKIRFQDRTSRQTRIKFMTDGILLAEAQRDRLFRMYDTLIIDEAHERTLNIDFLLGLLKKVLSERSDLKVIITSATIDPERFSRAFNDAPIIEVSGRTYPVEVWYRPPEACEDEEEDVGHVAQAVACMDLLKGRRDPANRGDVLIFMPTESDIRETVQRLEEKRYFNTLVYPLFGRMAASDQQRIFQKTTEEKIIVATNVAETSITIPRIRYVIDTGLARLSQYNPRSRTQGLPVVSVSRASADQRMGRCGRVKAGICIRLYSQEDYVSRPLYTAPEIQRSNLAEVILRMLHLKLGNVLEFPFIDPPSAAAVKDGFGVLRELGAVDEHRKITSAGRLMARLPLDPRLSRMIIEASDREALRELTILAAALSIQDPRERPADFEAQADQAHAKFKDKRSDFVALLKIWDALWSSFPADGKEGGALSPSSLQTASKTSNRPAGQAELSAPASRFPSRGRMRKYCRENFLSFRRIREWYDIHEELRGILGESERFKWNAGPASYEAIHRSVLSGYLSHIAVRKEKNLYTGTKNRQLMVFPGSGLFNKGGSWIVSAEQVQTSRLFARIVADIDPEWLEELGGHLCRSSYSEPHWEKSRGQVTACERVTLYGLPIVERRKVNYGRVKPGEAREIFIRSALVEGDLPRRYAFWDHNHDLMARIEDLESKTRRRDLLVDEQALFEFYDRRLPDFSDLRSFDRFLKDQGGDELLYVTEADLLNAEPDLEVLDQFPDVASPGGQSLPLCYHFEPGAEEDGVTVKIPMNVLPQVGSEHFYWLVPGMLLEKVTLLLKGLPKNLRKQLVPVTDTARKLMGSLEFGEGDLHVQLSRALARNYGVKVPLDEWDEKGLPPFLRMRFEVVSPDGNVLAAGRELEALKSLSSSLPRADVRLLEMMRPEWEREGAASWVFGDVPAMVELGRDSLGIIQMAYPGLKDEGGKAALRLFLDPAEAARETVAGLMALYRAAFAGELKQLRRSWAFPEDMAPHLFFMGKRSEANELLQQYILREAFDLHEPQGPEREKFQRVVQTMTGHLGELGASMIQEVLAAVEEYGLTRRALQRFREMAAGNGAVLSRINPLLQELKSLVPPDFLDHYRRERISELPRYLKALRIRAERAYAAPEKDVLKESQTSLHVSRYREMTTEPVERIGEEARRLAEDYRWMLEEYKVSVFAPEVKTRGRISAVRLEEKWQEWLFWKKKTS